MWWNQLTKEEQDSMKEEKKLEDQAQTKLEEEKEELPEEMHVDRWEGHLTPCEEVKINVRFKAIEQKKFEEYLLLNVEDNEKQSVFQEEQKILIKAEAFQISVKF